MVIDILTVDITQNDTTICAGDSLVLSTVDLENGKVGFWNFDGNANDQSGNGNNGTRWIYSFKKMEFKNQEKAVSFYNSFKKLKSIAEPNYDFTNISVDFFNGMGRMYKMRYENDKENSKNLLDSCIKYFNNSLALNTNQYTPNYDLGILYHNLGVDIILEELDIDADLEMVILMQEKAVNYFSKSLPFLEKVYKMKPEETSIVQGIAAVYYSLNDMEKHVEFMNILKDLETKSPEED